MKIGVAFSGSGSAALDAHLFANALCRHSVQIDAASSTSLPSVPLLLWAAGLPDGEVSELITAFTGARSPEDGVSLLEKLGVFQGPRKYKLAISCVDTLTGITVIYADYLRSDAWNLKVLPLKGNEAQALLSTLSPYGGMEPYFSDGMQLCDFSVRYGCPLFPLKMAGMERLLSLSFTGGEEPAQIAADSLNMLTGRYADLCYAAAPKDAADLDTFFEGKVPQLYDHLLF